MSWSIDNVKAPDAYSNAATLDGLPNVRRATLDVFNQPVYIQVKRSIAQAGSGMSEGSATWGAEERVNPGSKPILRSSIVGIRFRAAVPAAQIPAGSVQAQVTLVVPG